MKICFLGAGTWGFCLAALLSSKGYEITVWARNQDYLNELEKSRKHPKLPELKASDNISFTSDLAAAIKESDIIVESVTSAGVRPVLMQIKEFGDLSCPIVFTSKGIEQNTVFLHTEIAIDVFGEQVRPYLSCLSGPSIAEEVAHGLPTSVVCCAYEKETMFAVRDAFATPTFRVYPNQDVNGVQFGGAMKNIMGIACGAADGLGFGDNTKAAIMTRGLHEIRKLSVVKGCKEETLNGLAGMGDLCVTCLSKFSRNYTFGNLVAQGNSIEEAKNKIGAVVEGLYSCVSALQLSKQIGVELPITQAVYGVAYEGLSPKEAVQNLMQRATKEEHL